MGVAILTGAIRLAGVLLPLALIFGLPSGLGLWFLARYRHKKRAELTLG